ncbi:MAG: phytoene desaturase family protein, partial [Tagaea sp.]
LAGRRLDQDVELRRMDPFYLIRFDDGETMRCTGDLDAMRAEVRRLAPADVDGFDRFISESERIFRVAFTDLADKPFHTLSSLVTAAPDLIRLQGFRTVYSRVSDFFRDDRMRVAFSFHPLLIGGNPMATTAYYCLIAHLERLHGVHYAKGGMGALVRGILGLAERLGGRIRYGAEVARIAVEDGRASGVELADGEKIAADIVISNADAAWTYGKLLADHPRRRWTDRKIARARYSMGLFVWYFGVDRRYDDVYHHTMVLGPRYAELLDDIFVRKTLAEDFSLYLHRPTATDPSLAPAGCDTFYALVPVPHLGGGIDWAAHAEPFRRQVQERLERTILPGLGGHIVTSRMMTPLDFRDRLL